MTAGQTDTDAEPGRALRAFLGLVLCSPPTEGGEGVAFSTPAGLSVWRVLVASYPWPAALHRGHARLRRVLRSSSSAGPSALPAGARKGWSGQSGDTSTGVTHQFSSHTS